MPNYLQSTPLFNNYRQSFGRLFCSGPSGVSGAPLLGLINAEGVREMEKVEDRA
jgi:hypothetical protein